MVTIKPHQIGSKNDNILSAIAYLSIFFAPVILPVVMWIMMEDTIKYHAKYAFFNHIACLLCIFGIPGSGAFLFVSALVVPEYIEIIQVIAPVIAFILFILLGILFVINIMRAVKLFMTIKVPR